MIKIICVGKLKDKYMQDMVNDYYTRLQKYHKVELIELKDSNIVEEAKLISNYIKSTDYIIAMDIKGKKYDTVGFKDLIVDLFNQGNSSITFIIGGSLGIDDSIKSQANLLLSFSDMTFPHGLFRGMLLEQIYRSFKIINNESYHK